MSYELVKPLRGRVNALRAVKRVKSFLTPEGIPLLWRGARRAGWLTGKREMM
jgi:hypothetical protein